MRSKSSVLKTIGRNIVTSTVLDMWFALYLRLRSVGSFERYRRGVRDRYRERFIKSVNLGALLKVLLGWLTVLEKSRPFGRPA